MSVDLKAEISANREYKDSVFTLLFSDAKTILEVYGAITGKYYAPDTGIEMTTLKNVLYRKRINDLSFILDGKLVVLIEHQSTINGNMPLRMLFYVAEVYSRYIGERDVYRRNKLPLPCPEFIVLYNGTDEMSEDERTLRLSDMFIECGVNKDIGLELVVKMYNINKGRNIKMAQRSPTLAGYETFIQMIRDNEKNMSLEEAIKQAVNDCIGQNVLKTFLENHKPEVFNMLLTEWKFDVELDVAREEAEERGIQKGIFRTAGTMKAEGIDTNTIARLTGLTVGEVLRL